MSRRRVDRGILNAFSESLWAGPLIIWNPGSAIQGTIMHAKSWIPRVMSAVQVSEMWGLASSRWVK